ncbi:specifically androgen-regulated gene protein [Amphiprion ocellaris]|uniref:Specifically androgen-regulated gene protein n=1 Tax=Amphiprion ocellaris TaxID=80972 RepID=A0A3Q1BU98_AMPOC|nr:specifically androgen-regulated gene protein [Amphiprion ocellaris]XP_023131325.2 specifically androgen-regulated gene protein [Amphiprion ocellaris]XP_035806586.2 specifically androgen-regulated gene protein [Amphiprion ocellaris]
MPESETWSGGVAMESLSNMDSAGSCDSVISMNSGYSEDSMEHLSAEERACLMYLEETIEALEVQEDSGLSNDEPELGPHAKKIDHMRVNDISSLTSGGSASPGMPALPSHLAAESASTPLSIEGKTEHHAQNPTAEPQSTPASADFESRDLVAQPNLSASSLNTQTEVLGLAPDGDGNPQGTGQSAQASGIDMGVIPPPSDFMDEPDSPSQPVKVEDLLKSAGMSSSKPGATVDLQQLRQRAPANKPSVSSCVTEQRPSKAPPELPPSLSVPVVSSGPLISPSPEAAEPRSPPAVAPKPKKLPANIILKSHKVAAAGCNGNSGHSVPTSSDRLVLDPQRVRMEALRKLGLLKSSESDSGPALSPKLSPKTRMSWAAPSPPVSPAASQTPPLTPSYHHVHSPPPASVPLESVSPAAVLPSAASTAPSVRPPDILPAPAAFSDPISPLPSDNELSAIKDVTEVTVNTPPLTPPALVKQLTPPRVTGIKSATLERSGLSLRSYKAEAGQVVSGQQSLSQLRNTRPRPASLGSGREFSNAKGGFQADHISSKEPDSQMSLPAPTAPQHSRDSQKLPRSQGISVLICPRAENGEDRREALKKLGLLRD